MAVLPIGINPATGGGGGGGYQIERSLRFNSADSAYLNRTAGVAPTSASIGTLSFWAKLGAMSGGADIFSSGVPELNVRMSAVTTNALTVYLANGNNGTVTFAPLFRDPSAWYHIVLKFDTQNGTAANRVVGYVNGTTMTKTTDTHISAGNLGFMNNGVISRIGTRTVSAGFYYSGYLTEINFVDGQALTPSDFGETDTNTGVWKPKAFSGTYGTNGFYLNFSDNSGTTSTTLGKDSSGNGNNWTPNNFSVTAGAGNDSLVDSPTSYGTDTGVGGEVRGNYATFNALTTTGNTLTNGNLDAAAAAAAWRGSFSTIGVSSGKWYMEFTIVGGTFARQIIGIALNSAVNSASFYGYGFVSGSQFMGRSVGAIPVDYSSGTLTSLSPTTDFDNGDVVGLCIDADAGKLWVFKNNTIIEGTVNGTANVTWTANSLVFPVASMYSGDSVYANFGQRAFAYTAPSGFKALCTTNLPTPTIGATSTTQAGKYFNPILWTGDGANPRSFTGVGFQPDFVWIKSRSNAYSHRLADAVRGVGKELFSNSTSAEVVDNNNGSVQAFNSDGFTLSGSTSTSDVNGSGLTFAAWNWNAGGSNATNTSGTITSTVRANTTSGFSIVTYSGTGSNATVGHGLGVAPQMVIVKRRSTGGTNWAVWHTGIAATERLELNATDAKSTDATAWNSTSPSSTVFSVGTAIATNLSSGTYVAYVFAPVAGYSAFGSYTGNGSADGTFIYTGFRPRWVLIKETGNANSWELLDTARNEYNAADKRLFPNDSLAEATTSNTLDILSNGFKPRVSNTGVNRSGGTYIYAAFAEAPFKYSLAR